MNRRHVLSLMAIVLLVCHAVTATEDGPAPPMAQLQIKPGHPWRPPFGLERVGRPFEAVVTLSETRPPLATFVLVGYRDGKEVNRQPLIFSEKSQTVRICLEAWPAEVALLAKSSSGGEFVEVARQKVTWPAFEAEAVAQPDRVVNPVDLGAILVPADWLLLVGGQHANVEVAALNRSRDFSTGEATAWYESAPRQKEVATLPLAQGRRARVALKLGPCSQALDRDVLHVAVQTADGKELWRKQVQVMIVPHPPKWPEFGAVETKLRYDAPISIREADGQFSSLSYADGWNTRLQDVVVALPNGLRFVFWRGSSYIPFWAGQYNTGLCYEWAETSPPPDGYDDCVEPLMDKELRYGRARIIESTAARVHVRWSYQSCDFQYKVWGDAPVEDYYFYPDGFGTRVLTLRSDPKADYELSEFIVLTPQSTYPFSVLPPNLVDILFLDGQKRELMFPFLPKEQGEKAKSRDVPAIYRVRLHKNEPTAAIYFNPLDKKLPPGVFAPFFDEGYLVTPTYWGSHWPLARGKTTGYAIDDRVQFTPCHNSIVSWVRSRPTAVRTAQFETLDTLGRSRPMLGQTWVWLIGMSDADDARLLQWASSFSAPPSVELHGARFDPEPYIPERRAIRLAVDEKTVTITIKPVTVCVNPVFELADAPKTLVSIRLADRPLNTKDYAWDGKTLWLNTTIVNTTPLRLEFAD